jgi:hypothetical protein
MSDQFQTVDFAANSKRSFPSLLRLICIVILIGLSSNAARATNYKWWGSNKNFNDPGVGDWTNPENWTIDGVNPATTYPSTTSDSAYFYAVPTDFPHPDAEVLNETVTVGNIYLLNTTESTSLYDAVDVSSTSDTIPTELDVTYVEMHTNSVINVSTRATLRATQITTVTAAGDTTTLSIPDGGEHIFLGPNTESSIGQIFMTAGIPAANQICIRANSNLIILQPDCYDQTYEYVYDYGTIYTNSGQSLNVSEGPGNDADVFTEAELVAH